MKRLGSLDIAGTTTPVLHATREEVNDPSILDTRDFAAHEREAPAIYLRKFNGKRAASAMFSDLVHEACHAILWETGGCQALEEIAPAHLLEVLEERIVLAIAPPLATWLPRSHRADELPPAAAVARAFWSTDARMAVLDLADSEVLNRIVRLFAPAFARAVPGLLKLRATLRKVGS